MGFGDVGQLEGAVNDGQQRAAGGEVAEKDEVFRRLRVPSSTEIEWPPAASARAECRIAVALLRFPTASRMRS